MPGLYAVGGMYDSSKFSRVDGSGGTKNGNAGVYAMFQQMVYRDGGPDSQKGLTLWGEVAVAPRPSVSPLPVFGGGGLTYQGLIPGREQDAVSLGVIYGALSRDLPGTTGGDGDRGELPGRRSSAGCRSRRISSTSSVRAESAGWETRSCWARR